MNRSLLVFALLLVLLGIGTGFYLVSLFGFLLFLGSLATAQRSIPRPAPGQARQEPRRVMPPPAVMAVATPSSPEPQPKTSAAPSLSPTQSQPYGSSLFPTAMFPSLSSYTSPQSPPTGPTGKASDRDELIEVGAILALLKLAFG